jgi:hypothetical protein
LLFLPPPPPPPPRKKRNRRNGLRRLDISRRVMGKYILELRFFFFIHQLLRRTEKKYDWILVRRAKQLARIVTARWTLVVITIYRWYEGLKWLYFCSPYFVEFSLKRIKFSTEVVVFSFQMLTNGTAIDGTVVDLDHVKVYIEWAKDRYRGIIYYVLYTYFWPTPYFRWHYLFIKPKYNLCLFVTAYFKEKLIFLFPDQEKNCRTQEKLGKIKVII